MTAPKLVTFILQFLPLTEAVLCVLIRVFMRHDKNLVNAAGQCQAWKGRLAVNMTLGSHPPFSPYVAHRDF